MIDMWFYQRLIRHGVGVVLISLLLAMVLAGGGGCRRPQDVDIDVPDPGGQGQANGQNQGGTKVEDDIALVSSKPETVLDETDKAILAIEELEANAQFNQAKTQAKELLEKVDAGDSRHAKVQAMLERLKEEEDAAVDLEFAVENLGSDNSQARDVARQQVAEAGATGKILVRKAFRSATNPRLQLEAVKVFRETADSKAAPLIVEKLKTQPDDPLWSELLKALSEIVQRHSRTELDLGMLVELLSLADQMSNPLYARMIRGLAGGWEFGALNPSQLETLFARLAKDDQYQKRHIASLFCIIYVKAANRDDQAFADLLGSRDRLTRLQEYVSQARKSEDPAIKSWGDQMSPLLALVDLKALKNGLLLYFDFNEPIYNPSYRAKHPMIWIRDQSGAEVTKNTARTTLKGVLAENSRVKGVEGNGIRFLPTGVIELPGDLKFRTVMEDSYSYTAWVRPEGTPDGTREDPYWLIIGKMDTDVGLKYYTGNVMQFTHRAQGRTITATGKTELATGHWHHVAGIVDVAAGAVRLYVNGKLDGEESFPQGAPGDAGLGGVFGAIGGVNRSEENPHTFDGIIDEVRIYSRAINSDEVFDLYRAIIPDN